MDEQELQRLLQQAMEEIRTLGSVSKETADKIELAGDSSAKFKKQLMDAGAQFTRTMTGFTKSVGEGNTEFTVFNSVVDSVTGALTEMGKSIPFAGAAMVALGEGTKFLLGQLQATTKAFNQVSAAGLAGADGMSGLRDQFTTAGIDLQLYTKVVTANSEALARFGGTADRGADRFSKALGQVNRDFGTQLLSLGNSFEAIAEQTAGYMALQTRLGRSQNMTQAQLAKGAFEYAKQLDALAKLTGQNKDQLQKQQDAMMSETRFRARIQELENQGRGDAAERLRQLALVTQQLGPGMRDIRAGGGAITTEAGQEIFQATRGVASRIVQAVEGGMDPGEAAKQLQAGTQAFVSANTSILKFTGDIPGFVSNFAQVVDFSTREFRTLGEAAQTTAGQIAKPDALTSAAASAQKEMVNLGVQVNLLATNALPHAANAVTAFAEVLNTGLGALNKKLGTTLAVPQGGAAVVGEQTARQGLAGPMPEWAQEQARQRGGGFAEGGIARGPESGYTTQLHGSEAVVPLPDGNTIPVEIKNTGFFANSGLMANEGWAKMLAANQITRQSIHKELMQLFPENITDSIAAHAAITRRAFQTNDDIMKYVLERGADYSIPSFAGFNPYSGYQSGPLKVGDPRLAENAGLIDPATGLMPDTSESTALQYIEKMLGYVGYNMGMVKIEMQKVDQDLEKMLAKVTLPAVGDDKEVSIAQLISVNDIGRMLQELPKLLIGVEDMAKMADGGITRGPSIAGEAGPEAVIPLPNGRSVPVDMPGLVDGIQELVSLMRAQNGISNKILQASTN